MIDYLVTGEFSQIQLRVYIILAMWVVMVMAVCMDLWAGVNSARARGEVINSGGFRRTIGKLGDYWRIQGMALIFDVIGSCIPWYEYPYASMIGSDRADRGTERVGERAGEKGKRGEVTGSDPGYYQLHDGEECRGVVEKDKRTG